MDPNTALAELRALARRLVESDDADVATMADRFEALDGWLTTGGFLPGAWQRKGAS